jgi:hypothetical protein
MTAVTYNSTLGHVVEKAELQLFCRDSHKSSYVWRVEYNN